MIVSIWKNIWCLSAGKKPTSSFAFSLTILEGYPKLNILVTLCLPGYSHPKWYYQLVENFCVYLQTKNLLHPPCFSGDIGKINKLLISGTLGMASYTHPKWYCQLVENFCVYMQTKNWPHPSCLSEDIGNIYKPYFGSLGHNWIHTPKIIVLTCRKLQCLSACQKQTSSFTSFLRYYILKNPATWLAHNILTHNSRTRILPDMELVGKYQ